MTNNYQLGGILRTVLGWTDKLAPSQYMDPQTGMTLGPKYYELRARKSYKMHPTGQKYSSPHCAKFVNDYFGKGRGNAWSHNYITPYINGYDGLEYKDRYGSAYENHMSHNIDAAENFAKIFNEEKLDKKEAYIANMYYTLSPWDYKARKGNSYTQGSHTGIVLFNPQKSKWVVRHNYHGDIMEDPLEDLVGTKYNIGITSISVPYKRKGGQFILKQQINQSNPHT